MLDQAWLKYLSEQIEIDLANRGPFLLGDMAERIDITCS
jgi:hypothetical protein